MFRRFIASAKWGRALTTGATGVAVIAVVAVSLSIDDSVVTRVETQTSGIWLSVESAGELVLIDPATGVATNRVLVTAPNTPVEVIDTDSLVGVVERVTGKLVTVDPALGLVSGRVPLAISDVTDLVLAGDAWVIGSDGVARVPLDGSQPQVIEVGGPSTSAAASAVGLALVIADTRVDVDEGGASDGGDPSSGLAVTNTSGEVATITPLDGVIRLDDGTSACVFGDVGGDSVWGGSVTGPRVVVGAYGDQGTVHVSLLDDDRCRVHEIVDEPATFSQPLVVDSVLYVANTSTGRIHIVDLDTDFERSFGLFSAGEHVELIFHQGDVIAHEPRTFRGAVVGSDGVRQLIDKSGGQPLVSSASADDSLVIGGRADAASGGDQISDDSMVLGVDLLETTDELVTRFAYSAARVQVGVPVVFVDESTGSPRSWAWDFGDGSSDSGPNVEHAWSEPDTYQVTLFVDREDGLTSTSAFIDVVSEETAPTADFSFSERTVTVGESVLFTDLSLGAVTERRWDFGDGMGDVAAEVSKSWPLAGTYTVTLTVANNAGADSSSATITVVDRLEPPNAVLEIDDDQVEVGEPVRLRSVSTGDVSTVLWEFGDGGFDASTDVVHSYSREGSYTVRLTVSNGAGSSTASVIVTVKAPTLPPEARILVLSAPVEAGIPTTLASGSLNDPDTLEWDFRDGSTGSGTPVTHTWVDVGTYVVTLTATNEAGSSSTSVTITVVPYLPPPIASFESPASIRAGSPVEFVDTSSNGTTLLWDFGDGGSATTSPAIHTYSLAGTMVISLTVTNRNGTATATETVEVLPALPVAGFTPSLDAVRVDEPVFFSDTSTGAVIYEWDFGDGTSSTAAAPTHSYTQPGAYTVVLTVTNSIGETDDLSAKIRVNSGNSAN
jgi:PKD repeat protein